EREHGDRGEARRTTERSQRESHVLLGRVEESETSHLTCLFLGRGEVAETPSRCPARVGFGQRAAGRVLALHGLERQVETDLLVELTRVAIRMEQHAKAIAEDVEEPHA